MKQILNPFQLSEVRLLPGLLKNRAELNRKYMMSLENENLLQNHYHEAGLWNPPFHPENCHWGWESPTCQIRGHFLGHWLSAAAKIYTANGDMEIKAKAEHIVSELGRCQKENGGEWVGSIPEKYLYWIVEGKRVWAPQYTIHKSLMGLYDMYEYAGSEQALEILEKAADWFVRWTGGLSQEQMDRVLDVETGGMLEVWADLYAVTRRDEHLELMRRYDRRRLFDRLVAGEDALSNMHANTTIPEALGAARAWEVTGEKRWRDIAEAYWRLAVTERGYFCTGGQTSGELWTEPFEFLPWLGDETQELCTVYNMIRLAEKLMTWTGDPAYADYIERNLYNGILAQQNGETGMPAYHLPLKPGAVKRWGSQTNDFWCCHGTMLQSYSKNEGMIYYRDEEGIAVCQYFPSELNCKMEGTTLKLVQTGREPLDKYAVTNLEADRTIFPDSFSMNFEVSCGEPRDFTLKFRLPWWISGTPVISVDGERQEISQNERGFYHVQRTWKADSISIEFPKKLSCSRLPDSPEMAAFMDGPIVLAGICDNERTLHGNADSPETMLRSYDDALFKYLHRTYFTRNQAMNFQFIPLYAVKDERYTVYFPVKSI
ncbi:MAG: beta-L-arabinofuranosidase domain-containing protein [Caulobacteraceae bacterium]